MNNFLVLILALLSTLFAFVIILSVVYRYRNKSQYKTALEGKNIKKKLPFNIYDLVESLGGKNNIKVVKSSLSKVSIDLYDSSLVDQQKISILPIKGIIKNSSGVIIIFGQLSYSVAESLKQESNK